MVAAGCFNELLVEGFFDELDTAGGFAVFDCSCAVSFPLPFVSSCFDSLSSNSIGFLVARSSPSHRNDVTLLGSGLNCFANVPNTVDTDS